MSMMRRCSLILWWLLWRLRLARNGSRLLCRLGLYHEYQPGVCGWCGFAHSPHGQSPLSSFTPQRLTFARSERLKPLERARTRTSNMRIRETY